MTPSIAAMFSNAYKLPHTDHDKTLSPEDTVKRFKERSESANLHILKETRRIDTNRLGIPVYYSVCGHDAGRLTGTKKQMGKGVTPALAEASAVMELVERFSLYSFMDDPANLITATAPEVSHAIPFEQIIRSVTPIQSHLPQPEMPWSKHDSHEDKFSNTSIHKGSHTVVHERVHTPAPSKFNNETTAVQQDIFNMLKLQWANGYNYTTGQKIALPMDWFFMINEFNGSSAGNCYEEAVCQGACELIERHVSALICHQKLWVPSIDPASITNPTTIELIQKFADAGIKIYIQDFSIDTGIPTIGVLAYDPETFPESSEIIWTAGTAPSPDKALSRALTEVAQLAGDFNTSSNYVASGLPKFTSLAQASYIIDPIEQNQYPPIPLAALPDISSDNIKDEIEAIINALRLIGLELIVINTTDPRLGIPACYTIVPGTYFRERAENSSIPMFAARHIYANEPIESAYEQLTQIAHLMPDQYVIAFYRGLCQLDMENPEEALEHLKTAMALNPAHQDIATICSYTGVCLKELGQYEKALTILKKGIEHDDERPDLHNLMGFCHFMLKNHNASIACFKEVLKYTPDSGIDHASIASNYRELQNYEKAIEYYQLALTLDPSLDFAIENIKRLEPLITNS